MVKNVQGGSKNKSQARKLSSSCAGSHTPLRLSKHELEKYACVIKYFGQGRCSVKTVDDIELQCLIRNKFKGHHRRSNTVAIGSILLVGLREWEGVDNYKNCDLLEVYDQDDYNQLKGIPNTRVGNLERYLTSPLFSNNTPSGTDDFIFSDEEVIERTVAKQFIPNEEQLGTIDENDNIDIDDI